ncbi:contractile injection system tape measure protein [Bacterioplanoides sp.]|uniref:contractile injection system tape measure protein n=1 Tax=Bacterioplanoides sp. TaxID=2066072 RepID=UPI003B5B1F90
MTNQGLIARCRWDTSIDDEDYSFALQQFLSRWTQPEFQKMVTRCAEDILPDNQCWRIDSLQLDLGMIRFDDLNTQLPEKVEEALRSALKEHVRLHTGFAATPEIAQQERLISQDRFEQSELTSDDSRSDEKNAVNWFIERGTAPWWYRSSDSIRDALNKQLDSDPAFIRTIVGKIQGRGTLRRRVLWQCGENGSQHIVRHLGSHYYEAIESQINLLSSLNKKYRILSTDIARLNEYLWQRAAEFLLINRATTLSLHFLNQYLLISLSQKFAMYHDNMIEKFLECCEGSEQRDIVSNGMLNNISLNSWFKAVTPEGSTAVTTAADVLIRMLADKKARAHVHYGNGRSSLKRELSLNEAIFDLAEEDSKTLVRVLRRYAREKSVRRHLIRQFDRPERIKVIYLLAPDDGDFISAHTLNTEKSVSEKKKEADIVWDIVFAYLLNDSGTQFNRLQFIKHTLSDISHEQGISYSYLLSMLLEFIRKDSTLHKKSELIRILLRLQKEEKPKQADSSRSLALGYDSLIEHFLDHGSWPISAKEGDADKEYPVLAFVKKKPEIVIRLIQQKIASLSEKRQEALFVNFVEMLGVKESQICLKKQIKNQCSELNELIHLFPDWQKKSGLSGFNRTDFTMIAYQMAFSIICQSRGRSRQEIIKTWLEGVAISSGLSYQAVIRDINSESLLRLSSLSRPVKAILKDLMRESEAQVDNQYFPRVINRRTGIKRSHFKRNESRIDTIDLSKVGEFSLSEKSEVVRGVIDGTDSFGSSAHGVSKDCDVLNRIFRSVSQQEWDRILKSILIANLDQYIPQLIRLKNCTSIQNRLTVFSGGISAEYLPLRREIYDELRAVKSNISSVDYRQVDDILVGKLIRLRLSSQTSFSAQRIKEQVLNKCMLGLGITPPGSKSIYPDTISQDEKYLEEPQSYVYPESKVQTDLITEWIVSGRPDVADIKSKLQSILTNNPDTFVKLISDTNKPQTSIWRICAHIDLKQLIKVLRRRKSHWSSVLQFLTEQILNTINTEINQSDARVLQQSLTVVLVENWLHEFNGVQVSEERILSDIKSCLKESLSGISSNHSVIRELISDMGNNQLRRSVEIDLLDIELTHTDPPTVSPSSMQISENEVIEVSNAGIVLLQSYLVMYLKRLGLVSGDDSAVFIDWSSQAKAIHCLQYLVTGATDTEEHHLLLNKVLCGMPFQEAIPRAVDLSEDEKSLADGLLGAMMEYWPESGCNSADGFRGSWLVRDGVLKELEDNWELTITKRGYDILLKSSPFSSSVIRYPWMNKPIYVNWHV